MSASAGWWSGGGGTGGGWCWGVEGREESGAEFVLRVRAWPLELVNGEPLAATLIAEEAEALRRQVAPHLFAGFDGDHFARSSIPAMSLVAAAYHQSVHAGER